MMKTTGNYKSFREEYDPRKKGEIIKVLFITESPPKSKNKEILSYFYNKDSQQKGGLWYHFNEALYDGKMSNKEEFLRRFQDDGYYLIDVFPTRQDLDEQKRLKKTEDLEKADYGKIVEISQKLFDRIKELDPKKVVLLGKRSVKLIAGCLPFRSKANADRFREFVRASLRA